jgi:serine/threonine-protein phosphatase 2A regulatory subunit B'
VRPSALQNSTNLYFSTIHGMVYNAMKLFMEVNPQLFDECSHDYTEQQNNAEAVKANRQAKWDRLTQLAESMKANGHSSTSRPAREGDGDPISMERLRLQDDRRAERQTVRG